MPAAFRDSRNYGVALPKVLAMAAMMVASLGMSACFGGGGVERPGEVQRGSSGTGPSVELAVFSSSGERIRTHKQLTVTEILPRGDQATSTIDESFVQEVVSIDAERQPLQVIRRWERFLTRVERPGAETIEQTGALEGSEVELTRRVSGVTARVVSGRADAGQLNGMLIGGMESAMLPTGPVRVGDRWVIDAGARGEFAGIFKALGLTPSRSEQRCALVALENVPGDDLGMQKPTTARISIDWQITGTMAGDTPMVMRLAGEIVLDFGNGLVTKLELTGGRQASDGTVRRQISILIERTRVSGWYE